MNLIIDKIPRHSNEGLFWGNGQIGCLMYFKNNSSIHFSMDHNMLWETRDERNTSAVTPFHKVSKNKDDFINGKFSLSTCSENKIYPTKLPGLGFDLVMKNDIQDFYADLDIRKASSKICFSTSENKYNGFIYLDSLQNILVIDIDHNDFNIHFCGWDLNNEKLSILKNFGYKTFSEKQTGNIKHYIQPFGFDMSAICSMLAADNKKYITVEICNSSNQLECIEKNSNTLLNYSRFQAQYWQNHVDDWCNFWDKSKVVTPDNELNDAYNIELYKMHCNIRSDTLPVTLQGIWNTDEYMPPWLGDWHNDLNVQACYWPCYRTNHAADAQSYIDYYYSCKPQFEKRAKEYFGIDNAVHVPVTMALNGHASGSEWTFWNMLLGGELMVSVDFCMYFEYTQDVDSLRQKIYPFLKEVTKLYTSIAYEDSNGFWHIPFTNSPEVTDENNKLLIEDDSTFIISSLHYIFKKLQKYSKILNYEDESELWDAYDKKLIQVKEGENGLPIFPELDLKYSHRHFCQLYPIFPLSTDVHNLTAQKSLDHVINLGLVGYAAFSFPYLSMFASRCNRGNMAYIMLKLYSSAFRTSNTFTVNGDPKNTGLLKVSSQNAGEDSTAFTLEAGFMFASAICDMFVHRCENNVYIGAGIPDDWKYAECQNIKIEGGHLVNIKIENYKIVHLSVLPYKSEKIKIILFPDETCFDISLQEGVTNRII